MNTWGHWFRVTTWGESHGPALGCTIDGCPAGLPLAEADLQVELDRRRPGQSALVSPRGELDRVEILSGVFEGVTTGAPLSLCVRNGDADPSRYEPMRDLYRPSHADFTTAAKFGVRDWRGGGRSSARETVARVAAGAVARKRLALRHGIEVVAWVSDVGEASAAVNPDTVTRAQVDGNAVRCPDREAAARMEAIITEARRARDTVGGCVRCVVRGVPAGWGEPVFGKLTATLAAAMMSLPASRGFEMGAGFEAARMRGTAHNDPFVQRDGRILPEKNDAGGVLGGISTGAPLLFRVAFKPVATHFSPQQSVTTAGEPVEFAAQGRHDPCVVPRAVPIVEAMAALTLIDAALAQSARAAWQPPRSS